MTNLRLLATAVASGLVGAAIGYKIAERKLSEEFEERLERETNLVRRMHKPEYDSPEEMVEKLYGEAAEAMQQYQAESKDPVAYHKIRTSDVAVGEKEEAVPVQRTIFQAADDRGEIYVISVKEHAEDEAGYQNVTWTYYAKDGVVTDDAEEVIEDYTKFLGENFAAHFGENSGDANVVYIRNEVVMIDYEILRDPNSYVEAVLGEEYVAPVERPSKRMHGG